MVSLQRCLYHEKKTLRNKGIWGGKEQLLFFHCSHLLYYRQIVTKEWLGSYLCEGNLISLFILFLKCVTPVNISPLPELTMFGVDGVRILPIL